MAKLSTKNYLIYNKTKSQLILLSNHENERI